MLNKGSSCKIRRPTTFQSVRLPQYIDTKLINGYLYVNPLANKLKNLEDSTKALIREFYQHPNKRRIRLQNLGGKLSAKNKGFVIDNNTVVDGLTRRIKDWFEANIDNLDKLPQYILDYFNFYILNQSYKDIINDIETQDKRQKIRCNNTRVMDPMRHGSLVHQQMYNSVRYILKLSGIVQNKQKLPKKFSIDKCTKSCLVALIKSNLIPITSEWPCFVEDGTGCATAMDLICVDLNNDNKLKIIELKTGNAAKALKPSFISKGEFTYNRASMDSIQLLISAFFAYRCYGSKFFDITDENKFCGSMGLLYINSSYSVILDVPSIICNLENVTDLSKRILYREEGTSLRNDLTADHNTQSKLTITNKIRKRKPKTFKVGFNVEK